MAGSSTGVGRSDATMWGIDSKLRAVASRSVIRLHQACSSVLVFAREMAGGNDEAAPVWGAA